MNPNNINNKPEKIYGRIVHIRYRLVGGDGGPDPAKFYPASSASKQGYTQQHYIL